MNSGSNRLSFDSHLRIFANELGPTKDQEKNCNDVISKTDTAIRSQVRCGTINRMIVGGSYEKRTALQEKFDLDLVYYINSDDDYCFDHYKTLKLRFIDEIHTIIRKEFSNAKIIKVNEWTIQFVLEDVDVDIVLARNFIPNYVATRNAQEQMKYVLRALQLNPDTMKREFMELSSCLTESVVQFIKRKADCADYGYTTSLIRLCKLWNLRLVSEDVFVCGRSSTMEIIAIKAAKPEVANGRFSIVAGFRNFLQYWVQVQTMAIWFDDNYKINEIPEENKTPPYVLDPVNPYNNRLYRFTPEQRLVFQNAARYTLQKLDILIQKFNVPITLQCFEYGISDLFKPEILSAAKLEAIQQCMTTGITKELSVSYWADSCERGSQLAYRRIIRHQATPARCLRMETDIRFYLNILYAEAKAINSSRVFVVNVFDHIHRGMSSKLTAYNACGNFDVTYRYPAGPDVYVLKIKW